MRRFVSFGPAFVVLLSAGAVLLAVPAAIQRIDAAQTLGQVTLARQQSDDDDILEKLNRAVKNVSRAVEPSVVHLDIVTNDDGTDRPSRGFRGSTGAGWVYDTDGHVITNAHVVRGASEITVQFADGRVYDAKVLGADVFTDIAVVQVADFSGLVPARRATGGRPEQGERVFAFGSPFGFKFSMSEGIVSGMGRSARGVMEFGGFTNFIQTDAAVNPGNSGGPLVDIHGKVIGMNVAIATARGATGTTSEGQSAGISFAIPLATIESVVEQLIEKGTVSRGFMGLSFNSRPEQIRGERGEWRGAGLRVRQVVDGKPAHEAGIKSGEIVTSINGQALTDEDLPPSIVTAFRPGHAVTLRVWDGTDFREVAVTLGERAAENDTLNALFPLALRLGINFENSPRGAAISDVRKDSVAAAAGLKPDQVITAVGGKSVRSPADVLKLMIDQGILDGKAIEVTVRELDSEETQTVRIRLGR